MRRKSHTSRPGPAALLSEEQSKGKLVLFGGVKNARFRRQVAPGDVLELSCRIDRREGPMEIGICEARVDGKLACRAELVFAITGREMETGKETRKINRNCNKYFESMPRTVIISVTFV